MKTEEVLVTVYAACKGGFTDVADGRMDVRAEGDVIDRETAVKCLGAYLQDIYRPSVSVDDTYDARLVVAGGRFAEHGMVYADGLGNEQRMSE